MQQGGFVNDPATGTPGKVERLLDGGKVEVRVMKNNRHHKVGDIVIWRFRQRG